MSRPTPINLDSDKESWEVDLNDNLKMFNGAAPVPLGKNYANSSALDALTESDFDACPTAVKDDTHGQTLAISNGTDFVRLLRRGSGSTHGAFTEFWVEEAEIDLSLTDTLVNFVQPGRVMFGLAAFVTEVVVGPTDFDIYLSNPGTTIKAAIALAAGTTVELADNPTGVWPFAHYGATTADIVFVPNGGAFTSGKVRVALFFIKCQPPTS